MGGRTGSDLLQVQNFINGEFVDDCDTFIESIEPATAKAWALIPNSGEEEVERAVTAANTAFARYLIVALPRVGLPAKYKFDSNWQLHGCDGASHTNYGVCNSLTVLVYFL